MGQAIRAYRSRPPIHLGFLRCCWHLSKESFLFTNIIKGIKTLSHCLIFLDILLCFILIKTIYMWSEVTIFTPKLIDRWHISLGVRGQRMKFYINEKCVYTLPLQNNASFTPLNWYRENKIHIVNTQSLCHIRYLLDHSGTYIPSLSFCTIVQTGETMLSAVTLKSRSSSLRNDLIQDLI